MPNSYLMVTKWRGEHIINSNDAVTFALIKRVEAQGSKARLLAESYQVELNGGLNYRYPDNLIKAIKENLEYFTVCPIPDGQAREYTSYLSFENCDLFPSTNNNPLDKKLKRGRGGNGY